MDEKLMTILFCSECFHHQVLDIPTIQKIVNSLEWECENCGHSAFIGGDERTRAVEAYLLFRWEEMKEGN